MAATKGKKSALRYGDAMTELEAILRAIEEDDVDMDELAPRVERAAELIEHCRSVLERTGVRVEEAVASLAPPEDGEASS